MAYHSAAVPATNKELAMLICPKCDAVMTSDGRGFICPNCGTKIRQHMTLGGHYVPPRARSCQTSATFRAIAVPTCIHKRL